METSTTNELAVIDQFPEKISDIKKALDNLLVTESKVVELKEKYTGVTIVDENDEDGYKLAREAKSVLVKTRTASEDDRKVALKPIDELRDTVHNRFMGAQNELKTVEAPITARIKEIDDIYKQKKEEEKRLQEQKINDRINELLAKGMEFQDGYYVIKDEALGIAETSIGVVDIRTMSDDLYKNFLQIVVDKSAKIAAEKERLAAIEKKQQEEKEAAAKKEREEFEEKKKLLDEQEAKLKQQQDEIKKQTEKIEKEKKEQEQNRINNIIRHRSAILVGIGLEYNEHGESFEYNGDTVILSAPSIADYSDADWLNFIEEIRAVIKKKKDEAEAFLLKKQEEEKQRLELQEKERQAGLSDKEKVKEYITALLSVTVPDCKTKTCKNLVGGVRDYIKDNLPA